MSLDPLANVARTLPITRVNDRLGTNDPLERSPTWEEIR